MTTSPSHPVVIVGGGVAGLATARALIAREIPVRVLERRPSPGDGGLAVNLPGNAVRALEALGAGQALEQRGHPLKRREYRTASDRVLFEVDEDLFWGARMRPRGIRRSDLLEILADTLPPGLVEYGVDAASLHLDDDHVDVRLEDGSSVAARAIVGADGVNSFVRRQLFDGMEGAGTAILARASWRFMAPNPGVDCWTLWAGSEGLILLMPVGAGEVYGWAAVTRGGSADDGSSQLDMLSRAFPERVRRTVMAGVASGTLYHSPLEEVRLSTWANGRSAVIGDAAHSMSPVWAQGVALALEDAVTMAACLHREPDVAKAFADFQLVRRPVVDHVQRMTDVMSKAANLPAFLRNLAMPYVGPRRYRQTYLPLKYGFLGLKDMHD